MSSSPRLFPATSSCSAGSNWLPSGSRSRGCRPGSAGWASETAPEAGLAINELVRSVAVTAPIVIGRDHLDSGSVASPYRETEAMRDGSDAIADWPILNALAQRGGGRDVGERAPRRRRRDRQLDPRRHGRRRRRHRRGGRAVRARADGRSGNGRHASRRRGLPRRARGGSRAALSTSQRVPVDRHRELVPVGC